MVTKAVEKALKGTIIVQIAGDQGKYEDIKSSSAAESHHPSNILSKLLAKDKISTQF